MIINKCKRCKLWKGKDYCVSGAGNVKSDVMILLESPGKLEVHEDTEHKPAIAETGAILDWALRKAEFIDEPEQRFQKAYVTNAVKCFPSYKATSKINLTSEHKKKCKFWLNKEIDRVKPKYVLVLGAAALQSFTDTYNASIERDRGFWNWSERYNCWYLATVHPAALLRETDKTSAFAKDIKRFVNGVKHGVTKPKLGSHYKIVKSLPAIRTLIKKIRRRKKRIAWDLETTSLRFWDKKEDILGMSIAWGIGRAAYIPFYKYDEKTKESVPLWTPIQKKRIYRMIKGLMEDPNIKKDGQNTKFDINWLSVKGIFPKGVDWDTMQFHHLVDETTDSNLTFLTTYYELNFPRYEDEIKPYLKNKDGELRYAFVPLPIIGKYACADVDAVFQISKKQRSMSNNEKRKKIYYEISVPMSKCTAEMEQKGVKIDLDSIGKLEKEYDKKIFKEEEKFRKLIKVPKFNVNSAPQLKVLFFGDESYSMGLKGYERTKSGEWSTGKDTIEQWNRTIKNKRTLKILKYITLIRKMKKMKSTYLTGFRKLVDDEGRIHTSYNTTGTRTGRSSSSKPNLQNIPRDPIFRSLFIAAKGRKLFAADYSQIEARLLAWLAREIQLIIRFADPDFDPHRYSASLVRKKPEDEITKEERSVDKAVTFGMNYGRANKSIAEYYDIALDYVNEFVSEYFRQYAKIARWRERQTVLGKKRRILSTKTNRVRHFMAYDWIYSPEMKKVERLRASLGEDTWLLNSIVGHMMRRSINFKIQSYASDILTMATYRVYKRVKEEGLDAFLVLTVHDMIGLDVDDKDVKRLEKIVNEEMPVTLSMTNAKTKKKMSITFTIDYDIEQCWV